MIFNGLLLIEPYNISYIHDFGGQKFQYCILNQSLSKFIKNSLISYKLLVILCLIILTPIFSKLSGLSASSEFKFIFLKKQE